MKGEREEAKSLLERALELDPKNSHAEEVIEISKQTPVDIENIQSTFDLHSEFSELKESDFFKTINIIAFRTEEDEDRIQSKIDTAFRSEVVPNIDILKGLSRENRMEWLRIEIDFINDAVETISEEQLKFEKEVNDRFPFLPEDGIRIASIGRPALKFAGMSEEKLMNFIQGITRPNKKDIKLLKWAYEIGNKHLELSSYRDDLPAYEKDILDILRERLNKETAVICMFKIIENEMHDK